MSKLEIKRVHILGVGGTLMGAFAALLKRQGVEVSGSDAKLYPPMSDVLKNAQIRTFEGYDSKNIESLPEKPDVVIVGNVIRKDNPEVVELQQMGLKRVSLPEFMETHFLRDTINCLASGTHGKTTTSSLLAHVLKFCRRDPSYFIGGVCHDLPHSFHLGEGKEFVLEGDEYDTAFWDKVPKFNHYLPDHVILTSVEFDHADIYENLEAVMKAFSGLVSRIRNGGHLIACSDYENIRPLILSSKKRVITYGSKVGKSDFWPEQILVESGRTSFSIVKKEGPVIQNVKICQTGMYNVLNSLAVFIEARELGCEAEKIVEAFSIFKGVKRRQEIKAEIDGITVIDDFAHHPTAVKETLAGLKEKYKGRRLLAVFEPRSATSRRNIFQEEYASAFKSADVAFIAEAFDQSSIDEKDRFSSQQLVSDISRAGGEAHLFLKVAEGVKMLVENSKSGDAIAVLSNGGFDGFILKLIAALKK